MKRRSFLKICAGIVAAPLSFLEAAAPVAAPAGGYIPVFKTRKLKATWTKELEADLKAAYGMEEWQTVHVGMSTAEEN